MRTRLLLAVLALAATAGVAAGEDLRQPSPPGAKVFIIEPADGAVLSSPLNVRFGISGMALSPAGTHAEHAGHHHVLIDQKLTDPMAPIPADEHHRHFGKAQTEASIALPPGQHTLQLVLGDHNHVPHNPPVVSDVINITVK